MLSTVGEPGQSLALLQNGYVCTQITNATPPAWAGGAFDELSRTFSRHPACRLQTLVNRFMNGVFKLPNLLVGTASVGLGLSCLLKRFVAN